MITTRSAVVLLIGAAATAASVGLAAPANATCSKKCQTIQNELKQSANALESGKLNAHQTALTTTRIEQLGFWIMAYDQQQKQWYETNLPKNVTITGLVPNKSNPELGFDIDGKPVVTGVHDPYLPKVKIPPPPGF